MSKKTIRVTKRKGSGSGFVCPNCKHWNYLGVYWAAHQRDELTGPCKAGCGTTFDILGTKITVRDQGA